MKKILSLVISLIIVIGMVGCTNNNKNKGASDNSEENNIKTEEESNIKENMDTKDNASDKTDSKDKKDSTNKNTNNSNSNVKTGNRDHLKNEAIKQGTDEEFEEHPDSYYEDDNSNNNNSNNNSNKGAMDSKNGILRQYTDENGNTVKEYEDGRVVTEYND